MLREIIRIALLCIFIGSASIPVSFTINPSPWVVWVGNTIGSLLSAAVIIYIGNRITDKKFKKKLSKHRPGRKIVKVFDEGGEGVRVEKIRRMIDRRGLKVFALFCPIFPGVSVSTAIVYILGLDKITYKRWMFRGVVFVSWIYVFGYWWVFVR